MKTNHSTTAVVQAAYAVKFKIILFILASAPLFFNSLVAQNTTAKPGIFYSITGNGLKDTSWLFGTFHLVNSGYLDELPAIKHLLIRQKVW